jgi:hypothetical protein
MIALADRGPERMIALADLGPERMMGWPEGSERMIASEVA